MAGDGSSRTKNRYSFADTNSAVTGWARIASMMSVAVERPGAADEGLLAEIVLFGVELEREDVVGPAGERARRFAHVALRVVADAHREELEQLAAEVLVRMRLDVLAVVEIDEHRRILEDPDEQRAQIAGRARAQHLVLPEHHPVVAHLGVARGEMPVPEERELLLERPPA